MSTIAPLPSRERPIVLPWPIQVDRVELGRRVRAARAYGGWSDAGKLAKAIGMGRTTLLKIEAGRSAPKTWQLIALAEYCGVPREFFLGEWAAPEDSDATPEDLERMLRDLGPAGETAIDPAEEAARIVEEAAPPGPPSPRRRRSA